MGIKCCHGCVPPKRHTACWDTCPDYIIEKAFDAVQKEEEHKRQRVNGGIVAQKGRSVRKAVRKHRVK